MPLDKEIQLALLALNSLLQLIASIKAQKGMTDDQILAHAKTVTAGNDEAYAILVKSLGVPDSAKP